VSEPEVEIAGLVLPEATIVEVMQKPDNAFALVIHLRRGGGPYSPPIAIGVETKLARGLAMALLQQADIADARNAKAGIAAEKPN
jgi:hypothetical protein